MLTAALSTWIGAFALTSLVEAPIYVAALRGSFVDEPLPWWKAIMWAVLASALTHPVVWFVFPFVVPAPWLVIVLVAEIFAITVEALWLSLTGLRDPLLWALFANASSVAVGQALRAFAPSLGL